MFIMDNKVVVSGSYEYKIWLLFINTDCGCVSCGVVYLYVYWLIML